MATTVVLSWFLVCASVTAWSKRSAHSRAEDAPPAMAMMSSRFKVFRPSLEAINQSPDEIRVPVSGQSISMISSPVSAHISMLRAHPGSGSTGCPSAAIRSRNPP